MSSGMNKLAAERNQRALMELVSKPGNDVCADCKARNPRWASHNLGIFICVGCASVHRKIGTHVSKVKSLSLDSWTKDQVERMKEMGNVKSNAIYNPNEVRHPPPPTLDDPTRDSELEMYIRSKYEYRRFLDRSALAASKLGPSRSASSTRPPATSASTQRANNPPGPKTATDIAASMFSTSKPQPQPRTIASHPTQQMISQIPPTRSASQPVLSKNAAQPPPKPSQPEGVWVDLISLQEPAANASLPLQYQANGGNYGALSTAPAVLPNLGTTPFGNAGSFPSTGATINNPGPNPFPQQQPSLALNPFSQQQHFSPQPPMSPFPASAPTPPFQPSAPQVSQPFGHPSPLFQNQLQQRTSPTPFYQPQPQPSLPQPYSQTQFLSPSPNAQFIPQQHSPQLQSTTPIPLQSGYSTSFGYTTPSPQPMMNSNIGGGMPVQTQMPGMGVQSNGTFTSGFTPQQMTTNTNPFSQMQYAQTGFPGQAGPQWGPM